jgi:hypothetical protein
MKLWTQSDKYVKNYIMKEMNQWKFGTLLSTDHVNMP